MTELAISRKYFAKIIKRIQRQCDFRDEFNNLLSKYDIDGYIYGFSDVDVTIDALHFALRTADKYEWIAYYCCELDFGKEWEEGTIVKNGVDIPLQTPDQLYDLLLSEAENAL